MEQMTLVPRKETSAEADAPVLSRHLYLAMEWRKRKELMEALGWPDWRIRHAAEAAGGDIIFGQRGMKHIRHATQEEYCAFCNTFKSQIAANSLRLVTTQQKWHKFNAGPA